MSGDLAAGDTAAERRSLRFLDDDDLLDRIRACGRIRDRVLVPGHANLVPTVKSAPSQ